MASIKKFPECDTSKMPLPRSFIGQRCYVFVNLRNGCYSVLVGGKLAGYVHGITLSDVTPRLTMSQWEKCHRTGVRNKHAYLHGVIEDIVVPSAVSGSRWRRIGINCVSYPRPCFFYKDGDEECFVGAKTALCFPKGLVFVSTDRARGRVAGAAPAFKVGDIVKHKASFLQSLQWYTNVPKDGLVTAIRKSAADRSILTVRWSDGHETNILDVNVMLASKPDYTGMVSGRATGGVRITDAEVRTHGPEGNTYATVYLLDDADRLQVVKGFRGSPHMRELLDQAKRQGVTVRHSIRSGGQLGLGLGHAAGRSKGQEFVLETDDDSVRVRGTLKQAMAAAKRRALARHERVEVHLVDKDGHLSMIGQWRGHDEGDWSPV
jgi:hypothetical protein